MDDRPKVSCGDNMSMHLPGIEMEQDLSQLIQDYAARKELKANAPIKRNRVYLLLFVILTGTTMAFNFAFTSTTSKETSTLVNLMRAVYGETPPPQMPEFQTGKPLQQTVEPVTPVCDGTAVILSALSALVVSWIPSLGRMYDLSELLEQLPNQEKSRLRKRVKELMEERKLDDFQTAVDENRDDDILDVLKIGLYETSGIHIVL